MPYFVLFSPFSPHVSPIQQLQIQGRGLGFPPFFLAQTEAQRAEIVFLRFLPRPTYHRDDQAPPCLKVWTRHCTVSMAGVHHYKLILLADRLPFSTNSITTYGKVMLLSRS